MVLEHDIAHSLSMNLQVLKTVLMIMIKNIQFKSIKNDFQNKLKEDINEIKNSKRNFCTS